MPVTCVCEIMNGIIDYKDVEKAQFNRIAPEVEVKETNTANVICNSSSFFTIIHHQAEKLIVNDTSVTKAI